MAKSFKEYARVYDIIYKNKDYAGECCFLRKVFKTFSEMPVHDVLDVACGTGNHVIRLAKMGFNLSGQDISKDMLRIAKCKSREAGLKIRFPGCFPMQKFKAKNKFDAIIAMFASIGYLTDPKDFKMALRNIRDSLKLGGLFVFDCWNKDAVTKDFLPYKKKVFTDGKKRVMRVSEVSLDKISSVANINYECIYSDGGPDLRVIRELHKMRYFDIGKLKKTLRECGFNVLCASGFMRLDGKITDKDWVVSMVVRRGQ